MYTTRIAHEAVRLLGEMWPSLAAVLTEPDESGLVNGDALRLAFAQVRFQFREH